MAERPLISVVIPVYNEEKNIPKVYQELAKISENLPYRFEYVFVNDGSRDNSILEIYSLAQKDSRVKGLDFSRNFGKESATSAGCHKAEGDAVITMDADLQHPPSLIPSFIKAWEDGAEVVFTVRKSDRGATFTKRVTSAIFYYIFNKFTEVKTEPRSTDFRLMDKKVIATFKKFPERGRMFRGMIDWMGYRRKKIEFVAPNRTEGLPAYSYHKLLRLAINSFTSFSFFPLKLVGYLGFFISIVSGLLLFVMLITRWFFNPSLFTPIAILITGNTLLIGIVLISLGFIALYIARIHSEVINRPLYVVREEINFSQEEVKNL